MSHNGEWLWHRDIELSILERERSCSVCTQDTIFKLFAPDEEFVQYCCLSHTECAARAGNQLARTLLRHGRVEGLFSQGARRDLIRQYVLSDLLPKACLPLTQSKLNGNTRGRRCSKCRKQEVQYQLRVFIFGTCLSVDVCSACLKSEERNITRQARAFIRQELSYCWHRGITMQLVLQRRSSDCLS